MWKILRTSVPRKFRRAAVLLVAACVVFLCLAPTKALRWRRRRFIDKLAMAHQRHPDLAPVDVQASIYSSLFTDAQMQEFLVGHSLEERCSAYFHESLKKPGLMVDPHQMIDFSSDSFESEDGLVAKELRGTAKKALLAKLKKEHYLPPTDKQVRSRHRSLRASLRSGEQAMHDFLAHARIFNKCFVETTPEDAAQVESQRLALGRGAKAPKSAASAPKIRCGDAQGQVFPWLTFEYPEFTRWDGHKPQFPGVEAMPESSGCFLADYKARLNGRGIVMTVGNKHVGSAARFLRLLRFLQNALPIQVVFHADLSEASRAKLVAAARQDFRGFPAQELWFVDASKSLSAKYRDKFGGFSNKVAATLFNSFEEMLLCDADTVLLKPPSYFFELQKYVDTGTMYFKDRAMEFRRGYSDLLYFYKFMPSVADSAMFNFPQTTNFTLGNDFFKGLPYYQESGVVAINRKRHFHQPMMMATIDFYPPTKARIHGDKELFWLGLAAMGDETYAFNEHYAGAVGVVTPETERHKDVNKVQSFISKEICSNHPAHISDLDDHTLLWFNSGFRHCGEAFNKDLKYKTEFNIKRRFSHIKTVEEFETFYKARMEITHAVVPPLLYRDASMRNDHHEPDRPWGPAGYCEGYGWCAYSSLGGEYTEKGVVKNTLTKGVFVEFTPEEIKHFNEAGDVWIYGSD